MPFLVPPAKVLVTGANGYVATWVIRTLLERGFHVRGTVRAESKSAYLRSLFKDSVAKGLLEFTLVPDMTEGGAFDEAVKNVDAIVHTASPVHLNADDPNEQIEPAVKGTVGILESAVNAGPQLKRVLITSSCAAVVNPPNTGSFDERSWNENAVAEVREKGREASQLTKYRASKTFAEKAAWNFVSEHSSSISWDLVTICPPFIVGPVLSEAASPSSLPTSMYFFYKAVFSRSIVPQLLTPMQAGWVDVRDTAEGHVRALEIPEAGGERFILSSGPWNLQEWFDAVNEFNVQKRELSDRMPKVREDPQFEVRYDATKACTVLGMQFRDKLVTVRDVLEDSKARGWQVDMS